MKKLNLLNFSISELEKLFLEIGEKNFRVSQIMKWIHQYGIINFHEMTNLNLKLKTYLFEHYEMVMPKIIKKISCIDGTIKWLIQLSDNNLIETVFIPEKNRGTLCISSQVGCSVGCIFCATGTINFKRNLYISEIIGQLWLAIKTLSNNDSFNNKVITNVVFMGMGEPLLNYDNMLNSINIMLDDNAYGISKYRITVSTCGIIPKIIQLNKDSDISLAISIHAPNDEIRNKLIPINRKYPLNNLLDVCNNYFVKSNRAVTIAYAMFDGINDQIIHAKQLVKLLSHGRYKINLIPGNRVNNCNFRSSHQDQIEFFRKYLLNSGFNTITRKSRGNEIQAACGQLSINHECYKSIN